MPYRRMLSAALVTTAVFGAAACAGDATRVAARSGDTFANGSSAEEYCGLVARVNPQLTHDLTAAQPATVQPVISAIGDLSTVAPEEIKGDLALMKSYLQLVVDAGAENSSVAPEDLETADAALGEVSARVAESVEETCGITLD